jgi:hypothetical protein
MDAPAVPKSYEINTVLICAQNSTVQVKISQNNNYKYPGSKVKLSMLTDATYHAYPKLQLQWLGVIE